MAKKIIDVGNGYSLRFDQRAKGEETPYYVGKILKDGKEVGDFDNGGRGGPTTISPFKLKEEFSKMVTDEATKQGKDTAKWSEKEGLIIEFGELRGYRKGCAAYPVDEFFSAYIKQTIADYAKYGM